MRSLLIVVDGPGQGEAAALHIALLARSEPIGAIHLLNVQPPMSRYVARFLARATIRSFQREEGEKALAAARAILDDAGLPYTAHIQVGPAAETIAEAAAELGVDEIVIGADGLGMLDRLFLRFLVARLIRLAEVPVVLIKTPRYPPPQPSPARGEGVMGQLARSQG
jgi:nucleotide-binding universal stress UspA family protein